MNPEQPDLEAIFSKAVGIEDEQERTTYLEAACQGHPQLLAELEKMVAAHFAAGSFLDRAAPELDATIDVDAGLHHAGQTIGLYKLREELGSGGFGVVWAAEQTKPIRRKVALKIIKPGMDTRDVIARFEAERQALALMDHPNIARVLDAGTSDQGRPYFVMELIRGVPITQYCDEAKLAVNERLALFAQVCKAIQHAHQKGIIHRDIKPSNVLVTLHDGEPVPKVIDFGVAKALNQRLTDKTIYTRVHQAIGTLAYMSPEQAELSGLDVDTRTDVYGLGVLLYELLTGTTPFDTRRLDAAALHEACRIIREEEPPKASNRISTMGETATIVSRHRKSSPDELARLVRGELDWIVLKTLEKDRTHRYESAAGVAADVERFLSGQPVEAHPPSTVYRLRKFVRRYRLPVAAATAIVAALLLGVAGTTVGLFSAVRSAHSEQIAREEAEGHAREAELARQSAEDEAARKRRLLYISDMGLAREAWGSGDLTRFEALLRRHVPRGNDDDLRGFEWFYLWRLWKTDSALSHTLLPNSNSHSALKFAMSADGSRLAAARPRGRTAVTLLNTETGEVLGSFGEAGASWRRTCVAMSSNGEKLAYTDGNSKTLLVRSLEMGEDGSLQSVQAKPIPLGEVDVEAVAFSSDDKILAIGCADSTVRLWDIDDWRQTAKLEGHEGPISALAFSPHENHIVSVSVDTTVLAWSLETRQAVWRGTGSSAAVTDVAYSPDGALVATACADRTVTVWDAATGTRQRSLISGRDEIRAVAFSRDGRLLAAGSRDYQIRIWNLPQFTEREVISNYNALSALVFLPDGKLVFGAEPGGRIAIRPINAAEHTDILPYRKRTTVRSIAFSADGSILAALGGGDPHQIRLWSLSRDHAREIEPLALECEAGYMSVSRGDVLAVSDQASATVHLFDLRSGQPKGRLEVAEHRSAISRSAVFSPSGKRLAVGYEGGEVVVWDIESSQVLMDHSIHQQAVRALCFCGDERTLLSGGQDRTARLWDVEQARPIHNFGIQSDWVISNGSSHDGDLLAAGIWSDGPHVKLWRRGSLSAHGTLRGHFDSVDGIAIFRDGKTLVSASCDRTVRLWDLSSREQRFVFDGGTSIFHSLAVSPDERVLAAGARDGTIRLFRAASPEDVQAERGWWHLPEDAQLP